MQLLKNFKNKVLNFVKTHKIWSIVIIVIVLPVLFLLRPKPAKLIETQKVSRGDLTQTISITGTVDADNSVNLSFLIGGKLIYLGAKKGDSVRAYQTLATLDQRTAQKNLQSTLIDYSKQRNTFDQNQANNQNRTPQQALNDSMKRILEDNQYDLDKSVNSVELLSLAEEQSVLTTPIAGILVRADVKSVGVNVGSTAVWSVVDPNSMEFKMEVDEADIANVKDGESAKITLDPYPNDTINLTVSDIDFVTHTTSTGGNAYYVYAKLPNNTDYRFRVGMNGNAEILTNKKTGVLQIPLTSVQNDNEVLLKTGNKFKVQKISTGLENDTSIEILSGLNSGDQIAVNPADVPKNEILKSTK